MMQRLEPMNSMNRFFPFAASSEILATIDTGLDILVQDERAVASRASVVESKLAALRQRAEQYLRKTREGLQVQ